MRPGGGCIRLGSLVLAALACCAAAPPQGIDPLRQAQLAAVVKQFDRAVSQGRLDEAATQAWRLASLYEKWQGKQHWQSVDARLVAQEWQQLAKTPRKHWSAVLRSHRLNTEARELQARLRLGEAEQKRRDALRICRQVLGEEHPTTAANYAQVATCLEEQGKYAQAQALHEKALAVYQKALGPGHPSAATCYNNIAYCLQAQGKYAQAQAVFEKALAIWREALGERHPSTAHARNNVAFCLRAQGQFARALPLYRSVLQARRELLGEEHRDTAISYHTLAGCLDAQGKHAQALPLYEKALAIRRKVLGEEHRETARSYNGVAHCLQELGRSIEAQPLYEKSLAIHHKLLGDNHPDTATAYNNLAGCLAWLGQEAQALPLYEKALKISLATQGEEHPATAACYGNVAYSLSDRGQHALALEFYEKALRIRRTALGEKHPNTARGYAHLAECLGKLGRHAEALPLAEKALAIFREVLGEKHPLTASGCNTLALCLSRQDNHAEALPLAEKALAIWREQLGEDHPDTATGHHNVAFCLTALGRHAQALSRYRRALRIRQAMLGEEHPFTARGYTALALCLEDLGRLPQAVLLLQASLPGHEAARFHSAPSGFDRALADREVSPHLQLALGLARLGQPNNAYRHAEASLARGLLDDLAGGAPEAGKIAALSARLRALDGKLTPLFGQGALSADQVQMRRELARQRRDVSAQLARLASAVSARQVAPLADIQAALPADAALVFWLDEPRLGQHLGCVLRRAGPPAWVRLPGRGKAGAWTASDRSLANRLYRCLRDPALGRGERDRLLAAVRAQRLAPLGKHLGARGKLPEARRLFVVPTGPMAFVPVEALCPERLVSYVPSGSVLARLVRQHRPLAGTSLLALGDPVFTPPGGAAPEPPSRGLLLRAVLPAGAAARAGLQAGDVLLSVGTMPIESAADLEQALTSGPGRARYWRNGKVGRTAPLPAGPLGASLDPLPPPQAVRRWRRQSMPLALRGTGHAALPGTAYEVRALAALVGNTTLLVGSRASEQELNRLLEEGKLARYRLLHFATHGEVDEQVPDRSRLILAQDRLPDPLQLAPGQKACTGELTVQRIRRDWQLDCDLVVLSACRTALGRDVGGDGLLGFAQAFLSRGARSVVLSRWKVDDSATALLMVRFYENLLGKRKGVAPMGRAEALREAQAWLRQLPREQAGKFVARLAGGVLRGTEGDVKPLVKGKPARLPETEKPFAHPYYWAAFLLVGDPS